MKVSTFTLRMLFLAVVAMVMASCDEVSPVELRDEHEGDIIQGGEECKDLCTLEEGFENSIVMDFAEFEEGDVVTETQGVQLSAIRRLTGGATEPGRVMIFDTQDPSECAAANDPDLVFPDGPFGNVAIIQEGDKACPDDNLHGGTIEFDFYDSYPAGVTINCLDLLDTEEGGIINGQPVNGAIVLFGRNEDGTFFQIGDLIPVPATADGEAQVLDIGVSGVARMLFLAVASGAISNICFTPAVEAECENGGTLLDFEEFDENETVMSSKGVTITGAPTDAITFDTQDPVMCDKFDDYDMLFPDMDFGNILVNKHRAKMSCANADLRGGSLTFEFEGPATINSMDLFDTEEEGGTVTFYGPGNTFLATLAIPVIGDGEYQSVSPGIQGVMKFVIDFGGSGGVDNVCFTEEEEPE